MNQYLNQSRTEYTKGSLDESSVYRDPLVQYKKWLEQAMRVEQHEPNACALATMGRDLQPSVRIVLLKSFDESGFVFFTNYESDKGQQLSLNHKAALLFYWPALERQIRIEGPTERTSLEESDEYFYSRPRNAQIGSAVSSQSKPAGSRDEIEQAKLSLERAVGTARIPRPVHWGGIRLVPTRNTYL